MQGTAAGRTGGGTMRRESGCRPGGARRRLGKAKLESARGGATFAGGTNENLSSALGSCPARAFPASDVLHHLTFLLLLHAALQ